jgi:PAS domain S-box-containing protein
LKKDAQEIVKLKLQIEKLKRREIFYKKRELDLKESEERFKKLLDAAMEAVALHRQGIILEVNKSFLKMFGYKKRSELLGKSVLDMATPKYKNIIKKNMLSKSEKIYIAEGFKRDGSIVKAALSSRPAKLKGKDVRVTVLRDITSQNKEQIELKLFKAIADLSKYGSAIVDMDGRFVYINNAFADMHGYKAEDLVGEKYSSLYSKSGSKKRDKFIQEVVKRKGFVDRESVSYRKDSSKFYASMSATLVKGDDKESTYIAIVVIDISDRKKTEDLLKAERAQLISIFDSIDEVVYVTDPYSYKILYINKFFKNLLDKDPVGNQCYKEFQNFDAPCYFCTNNIILKRAGKPYKWEHHNPLLDKDYYIVDRIIKWPDGRDVRFEIAIDITERKKAEALIMKYSKDLESEVKHRTNELSRVKRELEESKRLSDIGMLAATVAHEINNPLGVIKTAVFNIRKERAEIDDDLNRHLANIEKKISQSDSIIKNLLGYAKMKKPVYEKFHIIKLIDECIDGCKNRYKDYDVVIKKNYKVDKDQVIKADNIQLIELFTNIFDNAFQSFKNNKGRIYLSIGYTKKINAIIFKIRDNGCGIPKDDLGSICEPFFTKKPRGIGLGLTVAQQITHLHRGNIDFKSKIGEWTEVNITLPLN